MSKLTAFTRCSGVRHRISQSLSGTLALQNGLKHCNFYYSMLINYDLCTLSRNFVRFGSATPEFKTYEVLRPASIILPRLVQLFSRVDRAVRH